MLTGMNVRDVSKPLKPVKKVKLAATIERVKTPSLTLNQAILKNFSPSHTEVPKLLNGKPIKHTSQTIVGRRKIWGFRVKL
ncbi:MAG: hypothetical protein ACXQTQ_04700 [Candidatus Hecatellaceae archaeon]